ncbi:DUF3000 family protein [Kocuria sp. M1R5S2]|uniref:DUF3000 family protein n=1 Tax=Kocuria rhizosphaerae TaxID=3376285 RepID=UPI00379BE135
MSAVNDPSGVSQVFRDALGNLRRTRQGVELAQISAPTHLAPFAAAVRADVVGTAAHRRAPGLSARAVARPLLAGRGVPGGPGTTDELATGRFVLLHDPAEPPAWGGAFRVVTWARSAVGRGITRDELAGAVAWTWLLEALDRHRAGYSREGGTVSRVLTDGFGILGDQEHGADLELRASWTPDGPDVEPHLAAWADTVGSFAGLPPYPHGVTVLHPRR